MYRKVLSLLVCATNAVNLVVIIFATSVARPAAAQNAGQSIVINDPRPLAEALRLLEDRSGQVFTYEDPRYVYNDDVTDMTDREYARQHPDQKALIPRFRTLTLDPQTSLPSAPVDDPGLFAQSILDVQSTAGWGGTYSQIQSDGVTHVVPLQVRDVSGQWVNQGSILDVPISLPKQKTNGLQALTAIVGAVSNAVQIRVSVGTVPLGLFARYQCDLSAANETARSVLMRILSGTGQKLSWQLFYDPADKSYALNIHAVHPR